MRSELEAALKNKTAGATQFRVEINQQYTSRYQELLMVHVADHGDVPAGNKGGPLPTLGRLESAMTENAIASAPDPSPHPITESPS